MHTLLPPSLRSVPRSWPEFLKLLLTGEGLVNRGACCLSHSPRQQVRLLWVSRAERAQGEPSLPSASELQATKVSALSLTRVTFSDPPPQSCCSLLSYCCCSSQKLAQEKLRFRKSETSLQVFAEKSRGKTMPPREKGKGPFISYRQVGLGEHLERSIPHPCQATARGAQVPELCWSTSADRGTRLLHVQGSTEASEHNPSWQVLGEPVAAENRGSTAHGESFCLVQTNTTWRWRKKFPVTDLLTLPCLLISLFSPFHTQSVLFLPHR